VIITTRLIYVVLGTCLIGIESWRCRSSSDQPAIPDLTEDSKRSHISSDQPGASVHPCPACLPLQGTEQDCVEWLVFPDESPGACAGTPCAPSTPCDFVGFLIIRNIGTCCQDIVWVLNGSPNPSGSLQAGNPNFDRARIPINVDVPCGAPPVDYLYLKCEGGTAIKGSYVLLCSTCL
jgi:hypothetical protein